MLGCLYSFHLFLSWFTHMLYTHKCEFSGRWGNSLSLLHQIPNQHSFHKEEQKKYTNHKRKY